MKKTVALILAGGSGTRMGSEIPKQFLLLGGKPVITYSMEVFELSDEVSEVIVVCNKSHISVMEDIVAVTGSRKISKIVPGGDTRQESSFLGLSSCSSSTGYVLIHDSARPFLTADGISDLLEKAANTGAAAPVVGINDTVVDICDGRVWGIPSRETFGRIQTPQVFKYEVIMEAHKKALERGVTGAGDDCTLVFSSGGEVAVTEGKEENIKITSGMDMDLAQLILKTRTFGVRP